MIVGNHIVFGAYGFWLPNDPRGSWSTFVGSSELYSAAGPATTTNARRSLANQPHDAKLRWAGKDALKRKPVRFTGLQARAIAHGLSNYFAKSSCSVWACSILPDHVHLVVGRIPINIDRFVAQLKGAAVKQLVRENIHPADENCTERGRRSKCFVQGYWCKFLDPNAIPRSIRYVEQNPVRQGLSRQHWPFVTDWRN
jgi:REP element-mobilizing transposase RayT